MPPTAEEGVAFLEENKNKDGVITLASGLQYKVLEEGPGLEHPKAGTPCECHYAGRLIDGSEFDSSYSRGAPTTFAPNQVIKGWYVCQLKPRWIKRRPPLITQLSHTVRTSADLSFRDSFRCAGPKPCN